MTSTVAAVSTNPATAAAATGARRRSKFYLTMSGVILALVLIGFARTLYLRPVFDVPSIPAHLFVHGAALTSWFVWLFVQTLMVGTGRIHVHRRLGLAGVVLGPVVVLGGLLATLGIGPRIVANG